MKNLLLTILMSFMMLGCTSTSLKEMASKTVIVRGMAGNGSGVIINSEKSSSFVLTNAHVCEIAEKGYTFVVKNKIRYRVTHLKKSKEHDLCLMRVTGDLNAKTKISDEIPKLFDKMTVMGHPRGGSLVITDAVFSSNAIFQVNDIENGLPCDQIPKELLPPRDRKYLKKICKNYGGVFPSIVMLDSMIISAVVMPGSSGSPVFNKKGQLTALIFGIRAGVDMAGYAHAVPLKYIRQFLLEEIKGMQWTAAK